MSISHKRRSRHWAGRYELELFYHGFLYGTRGNMVGVGQDQSCSYLYICHGNIELWFHNVAGAGVGGILGSIELYPKSQA